MPSKSGFEEVNKRREEYSSVPPAPRWKYGPREATGTLVNGICMSLGGAAAFMLEELAKDGEVPAFSFASESPIVTSITIGMIFRVGAYFLKNGGSSAIGELITSIWNRFSKKEVKEIKGQDYDG